MTDGATQRVIRSSKRGNSRSTISQNKILERRRFYSLIAVFDRQGIPANFLKRDNESRLVFTKSRLTLPNFSLIAKASDGEIYSIHRLVQISAQAWQELQNTAFRWRRKALFTLARLFPSGDCDTWRACEALLPHVRVVLEHELQPSDYAVKRAG